jgi:tripartite-type tricarboxylate transporter receptor subunit TctC
MKLTRRAALFATAGSVAAIRAAMSQELFPSKPVRWVVGVAAGGTSDLVTRLVAGQMSQQLGQQFIVDNKPGGAMTIAAAYVARSPADGYTVMTADVGTLVFNQALFKKLPYHPTKDLAPVGTMIDAPLILAVGGDSEFNDVRSLINAIRANPGKFTYASAGVGSPHHLAMEMLKSQSGLFVTHVPYRGGAPAVQDTVAGVVPMTVMVPATGEQMIRSGRLKPLAAFTKSRLGSFPNVPTMMELGYTKVAAASWMGTVVPAATPIEVIARFSNELQRALNTAAVQARLHELGLLPIPSTPAQMAARIASDTAFWPSLIRERGISAE